MSKVKSPRERWLYQFEQLYLKLARKHGRPPTQNELFDFGIGHKRYIREIGTLDRIYDYMRKKYPSRMEGIPYKSEHHRETDKRMAATAKIYAETYKKLKRAPTYSECGVVSDFVLKHFGGQEKLDRFSREKFPDYFFDVDASVRPKKKMTELESELRNKKRFVIMAVGQGDVVDKKALKTVQRYCKDMDAAPIAKVCYDPAARNYGTKIDRVAADSLHIVTEDTALNNNLFISSIGVTMKQLIPNTGLHGIAQRNRSMILPSPKQNLDYVPTANRKMPHALINTGAITLPDYTSDRPMSQRTAYIATHTHVMGGIIVEIEDENIFHFRQFQFDGDGNFASLGRLWTENGAKPYHAIALRPGDWHTGSTDQRAKKVLIEDLVPILRPQSLWLEDFFDGYSINHHERKSVVRRAQRANMSQASLEMELVSLRDELENLKKTFKDIHVIKSNHDVFLDRYLAEGHHIRDPQNTTFGSRLLIEATRGRDPISMGIELLGGEVPGVTWHGINDDVRVSGIFMTAHGHNGPLGKRNPSLRTLASMYGEGSFGHHHTPGIYQGAWRAGRMQDWQDYEQGPSSSMIAPLAIYPNGGRELINFIDYRFTT